MDYAFCHLNQDSYGMHIITSDMMKDCKEELWVF